MTLDMEQASIGQFDAGSRSILQKSFTVKKDTAKTGTVKSCIANTGTTKHRVAKKCTANTDAVKTGAVKLGTAKCGIAKLDTTKTVKAELTVFLALITVIIVAMLLLILESARVQGSRLYMTIAANSSIDSLFSQYHRKQAPRVGALCLRPDNR